MITYIINISIFNISILTLKVVNTNFKNLPHSYPEILHAFFRQLKFKCLNVKM